MYDYAKTSKALKSSLKEKVRITVSTVVVFLISGSIASAISLEPNPDNGYAYIASGTGELTINDNLSGNSTIRKGILNIYESPDGINNVVVINKGKISQTKTRNNTFYATVNIANAADFTNEGSIVVDGNGTLMAKGIEKTFGGLSQSVETSSILNNKGSINIENASLMTGIVVDGYKEENSKLGRDAVEIINEGSINISNLSEVGNYSAKLGNKAKGSFAMGISGKDIKSITNVGEINLTNGATISVPNSSNDEAFDIVGVGMSLINSNNKELDSTMLNVGSLNLKGDHFIGMFIGGDATGRNTGIINIDGKASCGILGDGSTIINDGVINLKYEGGKAYGMYGKNDANVINNGSIYLTDIDKDAYSASDIERLKEHLENNIVSGDNKKNVTNNGVVRDKNGLLLLVGGETDGNFISGLDIKVDGENYIVDDKNLEKAKSPLISDKTVKFIGKDLDVDISAGSDFNPDNYLVQIDSERDLNIASNLIGQNRGVEINKSRVNFDGGRIDVNINEGEAIKAVDSIVETKDTTIIGDIDLAKSVLNMDAESINKFTGDINFRPDNYFDSEVSKEVAELTSSTANLGSLDKESHFGGSIIGGGEVNLKGSVEFSETSKIKVATINVGNGNTLVLDVAADKSHALDGFTGDLNLGEVAKAEGQVIVKTNKIKKGDKIFIGGEIHGSVENILASQYIYKLVEEASGKVVSIAGGGGKTLILVGKTAKDIGLKDRFTNIYDSLVEGSVSLNSLAAGVDISHFESLLAQTLDTNAYALATNLSRDNIRAWQDLMNGGTRRAELGEVLVSGMAMGKYDSLSKSVDTESYLTGLMAGMTYGVTNETSVGLALGGGYTSSEFDDNDSKVDGSSFYLGGFVDSEIKDYRLRASLGYQFNSLDVDRRVANSYDDLRFSDEIDTKAVHLNLAGEKTIDLGNDVCLKPGLELSLVYVDQDGADEGSETLALTVDSYDTTVFESKMKLDIVKNLNDETSIYGRLAYSHYEGDTDETFSASFDGSSKFEINPIDLGEDVGEVAIGVKTKLESGLEINGEAGYEFGSDKENVSLSFGLGYTF